MVRGVSLGIPFLVLGLIWEAVAYLGVFPSKLFPDIETVAGTFVRLLRSSCKMGLSCCREKR